MQPEISVIIPVYNEEEILHKACDILKTALDLQFGNAWQIVFANDGSRDKSPEIIREFAARDGRIKVAGTEDNRGKGSAVRCGMLAADGRYSLFTDCDLAYGTDVIREAYDRIISDKSDVLIGTRYSKGGSYSAYSPLRRLMSSTYRAAVRAITGFSHSDSQCGLKCFESGAAKDIFSRCEVNRFAFDLEALMIAEKLGYSVSELPVKILEEQMRESSKINFVKDSLKMMRDIVKIRKRIEKMK